MVKEITALIISTCSVTPKNVNELKTEKCYYTLINCIVDNKGNFKAGRQREECIQKVKDEAAR